MLFDVLSGSPSSQGGRKLPFDRLRVKSVMVSSSNHGLGACPVRDTGGNPNHDDGKGSICRVTDKLGVRHGFKLY